MAGRRDMRQRRRYQYKAASPLEAHKEFNRNVLKECENKVAKVKRRDEYIGWHRFN